MPAENQLPSKDSLELIRDDEKNQSEGAVGKLAGCRHVLKGAQEAPNLGSNIQPDSGKEEGSTSYGKQRHTDSKGKDLKGARPLLDPLTAGRPVWPARLSKQLRG